MSAVLAFLTPETPTDLIVRPDAPSHPVAVYLARLSLGSRRTMREALTTMARILTGDLTTTAYDIPWQQVRYQHAALLQAALKAKYAHTTANKHLSALRGVLKCCWRLGLMTAEEYHAAASVDGVSGERLPAGRNITPAEQFALFEACFRDRSAKGRRDAALFGVLYGGGLREAEACSLNVEAFDVGQRSFRLTGKGNKQRTVFLSDSGVPELLADWLEARKRAIVARLGDEIGENSAIGLEFGPFFVGCDRWGNLSTARMRPYAVDRVVQLRAGQAGIPHMSPHDFRRTFAGDLLDRGADLSVVRGMMGHANVQTTAKYDRRPEAAKQRAASLLQVPYRRVG